MNRYLIIGGWREYVNKDTLDKQDLIDLKQRDTDHIIDLQEGKVFDARANEWKDLPNAK